MWLSFSLAFALAVLLLFVPGLLFARAARFAPLQCVGFAPGVSVAGYAVLCLVYERIEVATNVLTICGGWLLVAVAVFACSCVARRGRLRAAHAVRPKLPRGKAHARWFWLPIVAAYLVVPLVAATVLFLKPMDGADAFMQAFDNVSHLGTIRGALDSGMMDPIGKVGYYSAMEDVARPFAPTTSFYPEMWHMLTAMVVPAAGGSIPVAINAMNCAFSFVVAPMGVCALVFQLFGADRRKLLIGALGCVAFEAYPWGMLVYGPLYPNLASFALVPGCVALFLLLCSEKPVGRLKRVAAAAFFAAGLFAGAVMQPNVVFTVGVLLAPYCVWKASRLPLRWRRTAGGVAGWRIAFALVAAVLICALWVFAFNLPALYAVVHNNWPSISSVKRTLFDAVLLGLMKHPVQPVVALLVFAGVARTLRHRRYLWLAVGYGLCLVMYFFCAATDGFWDNLLTGFWYSDQYRIAAMVALAGMPLFAYGFDGVLGAVRRFAVRRGASRKAARFVWPSVAAAVAMAVVFCPTINVGDHEWDTAFGSFSHRVSYLYNPHAFRHLSWEEHEFAEETQAIVGDTGLIANEPFDGSVYLFGPDGMPVYYKSLRGFGDDGESADSALIREHLNELATNEDVQRAVRNTGIRYVLQLDKGNVEKQPGRHGGYKEAQWVGIASVDDDTPGFTPVLSEGDMRLYKIDDAYTTPMDGTEAKHAG